MGKSARAKNRRPGGDPSDDPGEVGPRQPCPCGSGRRYKHCHGSAKGPAPVFVARPFEGLASEADLVALRELVPAATAPLGLADGVDTRGRSVRLCTLLPMAAPALVRQSGDVWLGLQVQHQFGDPSRDLAAVLLSALESEPGQMVGLTEAPGDGPRLQDLLLDQRLTVDVHENFDFWVDDLDPTEAEALAPMLEQAGEHADPSARLDAAGDVGAAYWTQVGAKEHLRWVMPYAERPLLEALARLHVAGEDRLVEGGRVVGTFRAHGLVVPVWDLPLSTGAEALTEPVAALAVAIAAAVAEAEAGREPTAEERSARDGLASRQVTIR